MLACPSVAPNHLYDDDSDDDHEDRPMVSLRIGRMVQRSFVGRRSGCSQPAVVALLLISVSVFFFFQMVNMLPRRAESLTTSQEEEMSMGVLVQDPVMARALLQLLSPFTTTTSTTMNHQQQQQHTPSLLSPRHHHTLRLPATNTDLARLKRNNDDNVMGTNNDIPECERNEQNCLNRVISRNFQYVSPATSYGADLNMPLQ